MDNLTHSLVGLLVAKTGLERVSPYTTAAAVMAANAPDLDLLSVVGGRWSYLEHHRGGSHSLPGIVALSLAFPLICWAVDRIVAFFRGRLPRVRLVGMMLVCLLAGATHPLLDWTNNYGIRPLLPWNGRWFYGDLVFIMDPWLWLLLGGAGFLLTAKTRARTTLWTILATVLSAALLLAKFLTIPSAGSRVEVATLAIWFGGLAVLFIMFRSGRKWNGRLALAALLIVPVYWCGLEFFHQRALNHARASAEALALKNGERLDRLAAMPTFANPFRWQVLAESDAADYRFVEDLRSGPLDPSEVTRFTKPAPAELPLVYLATRDPNAAVFLEFARFPLARVDGDCGHQLVVRFADLRYTEPGAGRAPFSVDVPVDCAEAAPAASTK